MCHSSQWTTSSNASTATVHSRLFEFLTTLTFGELRPILLFQRQCLHHKRMHVRLSTHTHISTHTVHTPQKHAHTTHEHAHTYTTPDLTQHFRDYLDNIDCRHIDDLALHKVLAKEVAKNMNTHHSQFWLCREQHWLQSCWTADCPRLFEFLTTLTFGAQNRNHIVPTALETIAKKEGSLSTCGKQCITNCQETTEFGRECCVVKRMFKFMAVPKKKNISVIVHKLPRK